MATDLFGHQRPFFAPIATVVSLNGARRMRRAVELVVGVSVGVGVGDLLISVIGSGPWQIGLVVALAMTTAVWLDGGPLIVTQAGSSAVLVATLLPPGGTGGLERCLDALVGGAIGILVVMLLPRGIRSRLFGERLSRSWMSYRRPCAAWVRRSPRGT